MGERTVMAVVADMRKHGLSVELQILVDELIMATARIQAKADSFELLEAREESRRASSRERMRSVRERSRTFSTVQNKKERSPTPPKEKNIYNINPPPLLETDQGFAEWYQVYPRREARRAAAKAYRHALKRGATPENLLAGAKRYAGECSGRERQYIALPATWLNADRWLDEPGKVVSFVSPPKRSWAEIKAERMREQGNETGG